MTLAPHTPDKGEVRSILGSSVLGDAIRAQDTVGPRCCNQGADAHQGPEPAIKGK